MAPADARDDVRRFAGHRAWGPQTRAYEDYEQMLEQAEPDVACVFMQYYRNAEATIAAASRGIPVLCEKPVATRLEDLERVRRAVETSGVRLTALFSMRLLPEFAAVRRAVGEGLIGEPILAFGQKSYRFGTRPEFFRRRQTYGGTIAWVAIHAIDFVRYCSGLEYRSVRGLAANKAHPEYPGCEDCGGLLFEMSNGGQAVITFDYLRPGGAATHGDDRLRIAGSAGVAELRMAEGLCQVVTEDGARELERPAGRQFFVDFVAELRGQGRHVVGPDEAIRVTEVALRARDAADTGQTVRL
jgi:predicted dehydrogenase